MEKILAGDKFLCIRTVIMDPSEDVAYKKGEIYYSDYDNRITDELGDAYHYWDISSDEFIKHFEKVIEDKKDTNEINSFDLIKSLSDLKISNKIWRIKDTGEPEIIEFVIKHPQRNNCGIFIDKAGNTILKNDKDFILESWYRFFDTKSCWSEIYRATINRLSKLIGMVEEKLNNL